MQRLILMTVLFLILPGIARAEEEHEHEHGHGHDEPESGIRIPADQLPRFGLSVNEATSASIVEGIPVSGRIVPVDEKLAHVRSRYSGIVKEVRASVGDRVKPDSLLAVIQNNQNLQVFPLHPAISGTLIKRHATIGEAVSEQDVLFVIADLSEVWAELAVYKQDVDRVKLGQKARVTIASHLGSQEGEVIFFSPITEEKTQSRIARIRIKNPDPHFSPGAFVSGTIVTDTVRVPLAIQLSAVQTIEGRDTTFVRKGDSFETRPVVLGTRDEERAEVLSGLSEGESYAVGNTFILKAELGKSEAEHEH